MHPPAALRNRATTADWERLGDVLQFTPPEAVRCALLDPRGMRFQRLEWYGDSVLDVLASLHLATSRCCRSMEAIASDDHLGAGTERMKDLLDWHPTNQRMADWVEACVGAAYDEGSWALAATTAGMLVHEQLGQVPLAGGVAVEGGHLPCTLVRPVAALGAQVIEVAVALRLAVQYPLEDEGQLSMLRRPLVSQVRMVELADWSRIKVEPFCRFDARHEADHVQWEIGRLCLTEGIVVACDAVP